MTAVPIDPADPRLTEYERHILRGIAERLGDVVPVEAVGAPETREAPEGWRGTGPGRDGTSRARRLTQF